MRTKHFTIDILKDIQVGTTKILILQNMWAMLPKNLATFAKPIWPLCFRLLFLYLVLA